MFGRDWDKAEATIAARDAKFTGDGSTATYTYVADVRLPSGEVFRATVHEPTIATDFWSPNIGDVVSVLVRPKDRKVKFDKEDKRLSVKAYEAAKKQAFIDAQRQPSGTAQVLGPQVLRADSPQAQALLAALTGSVTPVAATAEDRLGRLRSLHERGLLTTEEYAEQRHRILDEL